MLFGLTHRRHRAERNEQLLKLYWNRAGVKRELRGLRRERYGLLDKMKEQEGAIARAREQLEGLERLLTNPLAAANAMVYFQLRHLWTMAAQRLEQFASDLEAQREKRERIQLHQAELAKRGRRLEAIADKRRELVEKRDGLSDEVRRLEQLVRRWNMLFRLFRGPKVRRRTVRLRNGIAVLEERIAELEELVEKIEGEPLPEPPGLSVESRRLVNTAIIAFAQHLVVHFSTHDLASLAKTATERAVGEMKFGDRPDCDRMVERIQERMRDLKRQNLADLVRKRTEVLLPKMRYRNDTDLVPLSECLAPIEVRIGAAAAAEPARRAGDTPIPVNVLEENYWDMLNALR